MPPSPGVPLRTGTPHSCRSEESLFAFAPNGVVRWVAPFAGGASPSIGVDGGPDGTIYFTYNTRIYAIAGTNALGDTPWPMYRQNARHTGKVEKPSLKPPQKRADANFQFELYGQLGQTFSLDASTNFSSWNSLTSVVATAVPMGVADLTATNAPFRFYRASGLPQ